jgi:hypothetical protein
MERRASRPSPLSKAQELSQPADKKVVATSTGFQKLDNSSQQIFRFVARQPILNAAQQVFGYELLFPINRN